MTPPHGSAEASRCGGVEFGEPSTTVVLISVSFSLRLFTLPGSPKGVGQCPFSTCSGRRSCRCSWGSRSTRLKACRATHPEMCRQFTRRCSVGADVWLPDRSVSELVLAVESSWPIGCLQHAPACFRWSRSFSTSTGLSAGFLGCPQNRSSCPPVVHRSVHSGLLRSGGPEPRSCRSGGPEPRNRGSRPPERVDRGSRPPERVDRGPWPPLRVGVRAGGDRGQWWSKTRSPKAAERTDGVRTSSGVPAATMALSIRST